MSRCVAMLILAGPLLAAPAPKEDDAAKLQGTWNAASYEAAGAAQKDVADKVVCTIEKDVFTFKYDGKVVWKATFKVDGSKKPKSIDMTITEGSNEGKAIVGIYEVDKDTLKWCTAIAGEKDRPTEFATKPGAQQALLTFKQDKP